VENDDRAGATRLIRQWLNLSAVEKAEMGQRAADCFKRRFHIEASARSLIEQMQSGLSVR
jgi:hypothetical protein